MERRASRVSEVQMAYRVVRVRKAFLANRVCLAVRGRGVNLVIMVRMEYLDSREPRVLKVRGVLQAHQDATEPPVQALRVKRATLAYQVDRDSTVRKEDQASRVLLEFLDKRVNPDVRDLEARKEIEVRVVVQVDQV